MENRSDSDCNSNICQYSGSFNERKCVIQEPKYGISCNVNKDCKSTDVKEFMMLMQIL